MVGVVVVDVGTRSRNGDLRFVDPGFFEEGGEGLRVEVSKYDWG